MGKLFRRKVVTRRVTYYLAEMPNFQQENLVKVSPNPFKKLSKKREKQRRKVSLLMGRKKREAEPGGFPSDGGKRETEPKGFPSDGGKERDRAEKASLPMEKEKKQQSHSRATAVPF